jgi:hypothetical protein
MDNHFLAIISTCPYMPTSLSNFVRLAVELGPEEDLTDSVDEVMVRVRAWDCVSIRSH